MIFLLCIGLILSLEAVGSYCAMPDQILVVTGSLHGPAVKRQCEQLHCCCCCCIVAIPLCFTFSFFIIAFVWLYSHIFLTNVKTAFPIFLIYSPNKQLLKIKIPPYLGFKLSFCCRLKSSSVTHSLSYTYPLRLIIQSKPLKEACNCKYWRHKL